VKLKLTGLQGRTRNLPGKETEYQPLIDHLMGVSKLATGFCSKFEAELWGKIAGLFHDGGKASDPFQARLHGSPETVDHSSWGGQFLFNKLKDNIGRALAFIICSHHGGLMNSMRISAEDKSSLQERLTKDIPVVEDKYRKEFDSVSLKGLKLPQGNFKRFVFIKMIYSSLVDADRLDSEKYNSPAKHALRGSCDTLPVLYGKLKRHLKALKKTSTPTFINKIRDQIQQDCKSVAFTWWNPFTWIRGFFTFTVPTGGGKTLASMLFALKRSVRLGYDRIIYVIPYTSIIEQNAEVFRNIFGENNVIEHHCNFERRSIRDVDSLRRHHLATENWDAPIIVTTNVQFFESLFGAGSSRNRRLHNIINSVIVLDEAHLLPPRLLKPSIKMLKEMVKSFKCSVVFCTATQPGLLKSNGLDWAVDKATEIAKDPSYLYQVLKRVNVNYRPDIINDDQMKDLILNKSQVLVIVNTKKHARLIYEDIRPHGEIYHLSTLMCAKHRKIKIAEIKNRLRNNEPCKVVSTQLIECGVDISFPTVIRNKSGIGSLGQSAGRCNREGEIASGGNFIVVNINHTFTDDFINEAEIIAERYLRQGKNILDNDTAQQACIELYRNLEDRLDKPSSKSIKEKILSIINSCSIEYPFEKISNLFKVIETDAESVIIPYDDRALELINQLREDPENYAITRALQPYCVQVYTTNLDKIRAYIDVSIAPYKILNDMTLYDSEVGLKVFNMSELAKYRI